MARGTESKDWRIKRRRSARRGAMMSSTPFVRIKQHNIRRRIVALVEEGPTANNRRQISAARLGDQKIFQLNADFLRVIRIKGVFSVDKSRNAA